MIRVVIVDDSVTQREILRQLLEADGEFTVVGEARNGKEAIAKVDECLPDVLLMDIHMPVMDGIEATRIIMQQHPLPIVIASATLRKRDVDHGMMAIDAGAIAVISKPEGAALLNLKKMAPELRGELLAAAQARIRKSGATGQCPSPSRRAEVKNCEGITVIGICASTGGPPVLRDILSALPQPYPIPVLLVQHISQGFEEGFARWLSKVSGQDVRIAREHQRLGAGIWMAPCRSHLVLASAMRIALRPGPPHEIHCPSGNPLFESLAKYQPGKSAGILLTGMGDDGACGLLAMKHAGCVTMIQNQETSLIWGMPKCGQELNAAQHELAPAEIASMLRQMSELRKSQT
jgi:two-component system, chemotaxis family, protein-glutamate methylesterase/glutaminase